MRFSSRPLLRAFSPLLALLLVACASDGGDGLGCADAPYADEGPWAAGVTSLDVDGLPVEVWYPAEPDAVAGLERASYDMVDWLPPDLARNVPVDADTVFVMDAYRDVPAAAGPFPVVYFSHGISGFRTQSSALTAHLATWGYVVVAPEHPERNLTQILEDQPVRDDAYSQILAAHAFMQAENEAASGRFAGRLDFARVAVMGHSAGGGSVQALFDDSDLGATAWVGLATVAAPTSETGAGLIMGGTTDGLATPELTQRTYDDANAPTKRLVVIQDAGHLAFSDICLIGAEQGGVIAIAERAGFEVPDLVLMLAQDGCRETDLPVREAWPVIDHYVTAHLEAAFGASSAGLADASAACFGGRVASYLHP